MCQFWTELEKEDMHMAFYLVMFLPLLIEQNILILLFFVLPLMLVLTIISSTIKEYSYPYVSCYVQFWIR